MLFLTACPSLGKRNPSLTECFGEDFRNPPVSLSVLCEDQALHWFGQLRVNYNTGLGQGTGMNCQLMRCSHSSHSMFWALNLSSVQVIEGILAVMKNSGVVPSVK